VGGVALADCRCIDRSATWAVTYGQKAMGPGGVEGLSDGRTALRAGIAVPVPVLRLLLTTGSCSVHPAMAEPGVVGVSSVALCGFGFEVLLAAGPWRQQLIKSV